MEELGSFCDCVVPRREDAVLVGGDPVRGFLQEFQWISSVEVQSLPGGDFPRSLWPCFSIHHLASALGLGGQRNSLRRVFVVIFGG